MFNLKIVNKDSYDADMSMLKVLRQLNEKKDDVIHTQEHLISEYKERCVIADGVIKKQDNYIDYLKLLVDELKKEKENG